MTVKELEKRRALREACAPDTQWSDRGSSEPVIDVEGLNVDFHYDRDGWKRVLHNVSFQIRPGECLALVGESGSGKSVTSRTLVGLTGDKSRVESRRMHFHGQEVGSLSDRQWQRIRGSNIGFVLQDALSSLDALRKVGQEIEEPLKLHTDLGKEQRRTQVIELLDKVGVPEPELRARQYPYELSGGQRQRALIASAIAASPGFLIADEPTTALDATVAAQILELLKHLKSDNGAMLLVSHDLSVVSNIADHIAVMNRGEIVEHGSAQQVLFDPQDEYTKALLGAIPSARSRGQRLSSESPFTTTRSTARGVARENRDEAQRHGHPSAPVIEVEHLTKRFLGPDGQERTVVDDISLDVRSGETLGVVGESGSGKTTLARIVLGVEAPSAGTVRVLGAEWDALRGRARKENRRRVQVVSQDPLGSFDPRHTVRKLLREALAVAGTVGRTAAAREKELMDLVRIEHSVLGRRPIDLSGGQRQRIAIARSLALDPDVIVADEPVSALDISVQAQVLDLFSDIQQEYGVAYLFISHDLGVINHVSDRILVMKDGQAVETGNVEEVFDSPQQEYTKTLLRAIPSLDEARRKHIGPAHRSHQAQLGPLRSR
ncbi:ABC transporter ATP-binding protein [Nesterenkonia rhizosphaerae]|uniref:ABC transporter ATP-binding protein n=1 Tax=Nesterenkonia rhizosphaerae TaxID=1348272 RepID=A0ABP9FRA3_9MICC